MHNTYLKSGLDFMIDGTVIPPHSEHAAKEKYKTNMPSISRLLAEGARITKPWGLMFPLPGNVKRKDVYSRQTE